MLKPWYHHASVRATNPLWAYMKTFVGGYATLYQWEDPTPPGRPVPTHVKPFMVNGDVPSEADVEAEERKLRLNKSVGHTHLCTEHFKKWMW